MANFSSEVVSFVCEGDFSKAMDFEETYDFFVQNFSEYTRYRYRTVKNLHPESGRVLKLHLDSKSNLNFIQPTMEEEQNIVKIIEEELSKIDSHLLKDVCENKIKLINNFMGNYGIDCFRLCSKFKSLYQEAYHSVHKSNKLKKSKVLKVMKEDGSYGYF